MVVLSRHRNSTVWLCQVDLHDDLLLLFMVHADTRDFVYLSKESLFFTPITHDAYHHDRTDQESTIQTYLQSDTMVYEYSFQI